MIPLRLAQHAPNAYEGPPPPNDTENAYGLQKPSTHESPYVSHGVNRKFHKYDPIDTFPMLLDSDLDLSDDAIGSQFVKKIFPSFQEQMVAKHIRKFMSPDTSSREALPLVKKFLKDNPQGLTTSTGAMRGGQPKVTEQFYTFWQDEFPDVQSAPVPPRDVYHLLLRHPQLRQPRTRPCGQQR